MNPTHADDLASFSDAVHGRYTDAVSRLPDGELVSQRRFLHLIALVVFGLAGLVVVSLWLDWAAHNDRQALDAMGDVPKMMEGK